MYLRVEREEKEVISDEESQVQATRGRARRETMFAHQQHRKKPKERKKGAAQRGMKKRRKMRERERSSSREGGELGKEKRTGRTEGEGLSARNQKRKKRGKKGKTCGRSPGSFQR